MSNKKEIILYSPSKGIKKFVNHLSDGLFQNNLFLYRCTEYSTFDRAMKQHYDFLYAGNLYPYLRYIEDIPDVAISIIVQAINGQIELFYYSYREKKFKKIEKEDTVYVAFYTTNANYAILHFLNSIGYRFKFVENELNPKIFLSKIYNPLLQATQYSPYVLEGITIIDSRFKTFISYDEYLLKQIEQFLSNRELNKLNKDIVLKLYGYSLGKGIHFIKMGGIFKRYKIKKIIRLIKRSGRPFLIANNTKQSDYEIRAYVSYSDTTSIKIHGYSLKKRRKGLQTHHSGGIKNFVTFKYWKDIVNHIKQESKIEIKIKEEEIKDFLKYLVDIKSLKYGAVDIAVLKDGGLKYYENNITFMPLIDENGNDIIRSWYKEYLKDLVN